MLPRIAKIVITAECKKVKVGITYNVAPTPFYSRATNQNGRYGVWVFTLTKEIIFVPFACFLVVEYRFNPSSITYGFVPVIKTFLDMLIGIIGSAENIFCDCVKNIGTLSNSLKTKDYICVILTGQPEQKALAAYF